jgi:protein-disulfide isomerase
MVPRLLVMLIAPVLALALSGAGQPARAAEFSAPQRSEIERIVREYLVGNPDVIKDAIVELQRRDKAEEVASREKVLAENADTLLRSAHQGVVGNPNGKITLVEFYDYNCGYCKRSLADVTKLAKENPDLRIVMKNFPVLGPGSVEAAQVEAAVRNQFTGDKFFDFHQRLLNAKGHVGKAQAMAVAKDMGADMSRLDADMRKAEVAQGIAEVMGVAEKLALNGTPSWVLGNEVIVGAVGYDELREKIGNVQKCGKAVCS